MRVCVCFTAARRRTRGLRRTARVSARGCAASRATHTRRLTVAPTRLLAQEDPFTRFLEPDQLAALQGATSGSLTGVGLEISPGPAAKDGSSTLVRAHACVAACCAAQRGAARDRLVSVHVDTRTRVALAFHACRHCPHSWLSRPRRAGRRSARGYAPATSC
jgi:hypothetical protein